MNSYTYYKKIKSTEHMLYANEIAELFKIYTVNNNVATQLVSAVLTDYIKRNNLEKEQLYYITSRGFQNKVYPESIYAKAIFEFCEELINKYGDNISENRTLNHSIDGKNYKFLIRGLV